MALKMSMLKAYVGRRSCHIQRIECLWYDVGKIVITFYEMIYEMVDKKQLNIDSIKDIQAFHDVD